VAMGEHAVFRVKSGVSHIHKECLALARRILEEGCDCTVRYRLLRDVLRLPRSSPELHTGRDQLLASPQVAILTQEQRPNGSWGRLHSMDRRNSVRIGTTEAGVSYALLLGMTAEDAVLAKAADYLAAVIKGEESVSDRAERNDRWLAGVQLFAASTLARIEPRSPVLDAPWQRWAEIVNRSFASGKFDDVAEEDAHRDVHGIHDGVGYLSLRNKYAVKLLGTRANELAEPIRNAYVQWLWKQPQGLGYVDVRLFPPPLSPRGWGISGWLSELDLLIDYGEPLSQIGDCVDWLWEQRNPSGLWDFGSRPITLRFSTNWRRKGQRAQDHSLVPLVLITRCLRAASIRRQQRTVPRSS